MSASTVSARGNTLNGTLLPYKYTRTGFREVTVQGEMLFDTRSMYNDFTAVNTTVTRQLLATDLGHDPELYDYRRMEVLIRRLRTKVRDMTGLELPLQTAHRLGYAFASQLQVR